MILVDTSVWIDHLRTGEPRLVELLEEDRVLGHPWVIGELALGHLSNRREILALLTNLPAAQLASPGEVTALIEARRLYEYGIGYVDAHLLASSALTPGAALWTRDKRLTTAATHLNLAPKPPAGPPPRPPDT
jgi:hypothetical protein